MRLSLLSKVEWLMLSNAFDKSSRISAVANFWSIASKIESFTNMFNVSAEWCFLFPLWCDVKQLFADKNFVNWTKAIFSQTFDATISRERGRLRYVMLRYVALRYVALRCVTLRYVALRYVTLRYALRYVTLRYALRYALRYVTLRYVTRYVTLRYVTLR